MLYMRKRTSMNRDGDAVPLVMQSFHNLDEEDADDDDRNYETGELRAGNRSIWRNCNRRHYLVIGAMLASLVFIAVGVTVAFSRPSNAAETGAAAAPCLTSDCVRTAAEVLNAVDTTIDPCNDFFGFVCSRFNTKNPIPDDRSSWSTFSTLDVDNSKRLRTLLEQDTQDNNVAAMVKARQVYAACMDLDKVEELNDVPLETLFEPLRKWTVGKSSLEVTVAALQEAGAKTFLDASIHADFKESTMNVMYIEQNGLGLPDPKYYLERPDAVKAYSDLLASLLSLGAVTRGVKETRAAADSVIAFEKSLAGITVPNDELRDPQKTYNPMLVSELQARFGDAGIFDWSIYIKSLGVSKPVTSVIVTTPSYFDSLRAIIASTPKRTLELYFYAHLLATYARTLPKAFREAYDQYNRALSGAKTDVAQWQRCVWRTGSDVGMAVGRLFVDSAFGANSKNVAENMVSTVLQAFEDNMASLSWMDDATRARAREKAQMVRHKIAFSEKIVNNTALNEEYADLSVDPHSYLLNTYRASVFRQRKSLKDFGERVDITRWEMDPHIVNAYYEATRNEIVFPAGILQPPFFSGAYPQSMNFGGIGSVVGHEISHGFDDEGRQYDGTGNFADWWEAGPVERFGKLSQCFVDQYSGFTVKDTNGTAHHVNGNLTLGENMADNGGIVAALKAYDTWVQKNGPEKPLPGVDLSHHQLFFVSFARAWCGSMRPEMALKQVFTDPHSPANFRVLGALMNMPEFATAFNCKAGSVYNPDNGRCKVW